MDIRERQSIHRDLASRDEEVRRLAVERLVVLPLEEAIPRLVDSLGDASWRVRKAAVGRLVASPDPAAAARSLVVALADGENPGRRNAAVEALAGLGPAAVGDLLAASESQDVDVRKLVIDALVGISDLRAAARLREMLDDADPNVRAAAAEGIGATGDDEAVSALLDRTRRTDEETLVRLSALGALVRLEAPVTARELDSALEERLLRPAALRLLGQSDDPGAVDVLLKGLISSSRSEREGAMEALLRLGSRSDAIPLEELADRIRESMSSATHVVPDAVQRLAEAELSVRLRHVQFLGLLRREETVIPILAAGRDEALSEVVLGTLESLGPVAEGALHASWPSLDPEARCLASRVLGSTGGERARALLLSSLEDPDPEIRTSAAQALGQCGSGEALPSLVGRLEVSAAGDGLEAEAEVSAVREALVSIASTLGSADLAPRIETVRLLLSRMPHACERARVEIAEIVGRIGVSRHVESLIHLLSDPAAPVRAAAVLGLARLGHDPACEPRRLALLDESPLVRSTVARTLSSSSYPLLLDDLSRLIRDEAPEVRAIAIRAAADLVCSQGGEEAADTQALLRLLTQALVDEGSVAIAAMEGLQRIGGARAARAAVSALQRNEPELLHGAIGCIGSHGDSETVDRLLPLVAHSQWMARAEAIQALAERRVMKAIPPILRRLETEQDGFVRDVILRALKRLEA